MADHWVNRAVSEDKAEQKHYRAAATFVKAMVYVQFHQLDLARAALAEGNEFLNQTARLFDCDLMANWYDWAVAELLRDEAVNLISATVASEAI